MTEKEKKNDMKLLAAIAGAVTLGAAGLIFLAGRSAESGPQQTIPRSRPSADAPRTPDVRPATYSRTIEPVQDSASPAGPAPRDPEAAGAEETFAIGPNENRIARALETYGNREFDRAAAYLLAEIEQKPERAWTHYLLGLALWKAGKSDEAAEALERAGRLDPRSIKTFVNLARVHNDRGEFELAREASRVALELVPENPEARFLEGRSLMNLGLLDEAERALRASLDAAPSNGYARNMLGLVLLQQSRPAEAVEQFEEALISLPEVAFVRNNQGMALELLGRRAEARAAYAIAVSLDAGHTRALRNLTRLGGVPAPETEGLGEEESVASAVAETPGVGPASGDLSVAR